MNRMYLHCRQFLFILLVLIGIQPICAVAQQSLSEQNIASYFQKHLEGKGPALYEQYAENIEDPTGRSRLWSSDGLYAEIGFSKLKLHLVQSLDSQLLFQPFFLEIETDYPTLVFRHSRGRTEKERSGVRFRANNDARRAYIHGFEGPGVAVLLPEAAKRDDRVFSFAVCPRLPPASFSEGGNAHSYYLQDARTHFKALEGEFSGTATSRFLSGLGKGELLFQLNTIGMLYPPVVSELRVELHDPALTLPYQANTSMPLPESEGREIGLSYTALQKSAVGDVRVLSFSKKVHFMNIELSRDISVDYSGTLVGLGEGPCYLALIVSTSTQKYYPRGEDS